LVTLFDASYHDAYKRMIDELREFLVDRDVDCMQITRLEFRSDLKRGDKKRIWQAFGTMLSARGKNRTVIAQHYRQEDLFYWLADKRHSNLSENFGKIKCSVYQHFNT
jgi:hypothetical protein